MIKVIVLTLLALSFWILLADMAEPVPQIPDARDATPDFNP